MEKKIALLKAPSCLWAYRLVAALSAVELETGSCRRCDVPSAHLVEGGGGGGGGGGVQRRVGSADWYGSLTHVCIAGVGECSRRLRYRLNPEHAYIKKYFREKYVIALFLKKNFSKIL